MDLSLEWPEPIVAVQSLSESGAAVIPERYVKPPSQRPAAEVLVEGGGSNNIPVIDIAGLVGCSEERRDTMQAVSDACREWGFFQVVNHGVSSDLVERMREAWKEFFALPMEEKKKLANDPNTYEGYGSRVGVDKDTSLDWSDYYYLRVLPASARNYQKWPMLSNHCMETLEEYSREMEKLCERLLEVLSTSLGFDHRFLKRAFGGEGCDAGVRVNYYPKCPQPDLALGLSPHSDLGIITVLLPDERVRGLQVRRGEAWFTIDPVPNAFVINVADQMQVISNGIYKSVEHRVLVNTAEERLSVAFFYNPDNDAVIGPAEELVTPCSPALYPHTTFKKYRLYVRKKGLRGKSQLESLKVVN